jgi:hypothetical protein
MEVSKLNTNGKNRCARLRFKGLFVETVPDPTVPPGNDRLFWCNRTQTCLGPDGRTVDDLECTHLRPCYERL